ncbi:DJ-1/PfpI family protein [Heliophilum fasciatum]|uniref:Cyclohexyl-isocyanide hydratase n=1 Tax=Heliophilum fasciatum TaxID=35700 RepID=A0A4V2SVV2_9FIRM|nr:DJ-1/PfpI family protein [Heliophilum fasciatum]MCW2279433.1 transcriptional regulator GlxA family with amidase domain [Heliophilum fasciatum]TCP59896.1 cyclohexyl-isocyanide hydratase [Heliophilum fasciatum]
MLMPIDQKLKVATLVCPGIFLPDVVNAHVAFNMSPNAETYLVWKNLEPFNAFSDWPIAATTTFNECPDVDVLIVGAMSPDSMADQETINFIKQKAKRAAAVIGICYGVLVLGSAGLLEGKRATSNFNVGDSLKEFGAIPVLTSEVVIDGNLYTAGPAHGCFEAAIEVLSALRGDDIAKMIELALEYNPNPKYKVGNPNLAGLELSQKVSDMYQELTNACLDTARTAYQAIRNGAND